MKLFRIHRIWDIKAWTFFVYDSIKNKGVVCKGCGRVDPERLVPGAVYFEGGEQRDIFRSGIDWSFATTVEIGRELGSIFGGIKAEDLYVLKSPYAGPYEGIKAKGSKIYKGPRIVELYVTRDVPLDLSGRSTITTKDHKGCEVCGSAPFHYIIGMEQEAHEEKVGPDEYVWIERAARKPGTGIFVPESQLQGDDFFSYGQAWTYCTERVREHVLKRGWTGVDFYECGDTVPG